MGDLKQSKQAVGATLMTELTDFAPPTIAGQAARLQSRQRFFNLVVTNVPGPQFPLYLLGRELEAIFPMVPLARRQAVCFGIMSYNGQVNFGLIGDYDAIPDLEVLAQRPRGVARRARRARARPRSRPASAPLSAQRRAERATPDPALGPATAVAELEQQRQVLGAAGVVGGAGRRVGVARVDEPLGDAGRRLGPVEPGRDLGRERRLGLLGRRPTRRSGVATPRSRRNARWRVVHRAHRDAEWQGELATASRTPARRGMVVAVDVVGGRGGRALRRRRTARSGDGAASM